MDPTEQTTAPPPTDVSQNEAADVARWERIIKEARKYDEPARVQMAKDRRQARGDSGFEVDANIAGTAIDIRLAFLYARDPQVDVFPSPATEPPDLQALIDSLRASMDPQAAMLLALDPVAKQMEDTKLAFEAQGLRAKYRKRQRDNKAFAETMELVISQLWKDARLKARARKMVRSALTIGVGWLKATWQERTAPSAETLKKITDLQDNLKRAKMLQVKLDAEDTSQDEQMNLQTDLQRQIETLQANVEQVIARGFCIDFVRGEDMQVALGCDLSDYLDAPWISQRIPYRVDDAMSTFGLTKEQIATATRYSARTPEMMQQVSPLAADQIDEGDANAFVAATDGGTDKTSTTDFVMAEEIWDRDANAVYTMVHGMKQWAKKPWRPCPTTRFYGFFLLPLADVDGQRHPQSLVSRSAKLTDEYNRTGTAERDHRKRIIPKTIFNAGGISPEEVKKVEKATTCEMVGVTPTNPMADVGTLFKEITYPALDPAVYDRSRIMNEFERTWGTQEALSGAIEVEKTATEAEIQQTGFNGRTTSDRDILEDVLSQLAQYTGEVAWHYMDEEDVVRIVGPDAVWPEYIGPESLAAMLNMNIRAGTTGKPNSKQERESWSALLPLLQGSIMQIAQLRMTPPNDVADVLERLVRETAERSGERLDMDALIPQATAAMPGMVAPAGASTNEQQPGAVADPAAGSGDPAVDAAGLTDTASGGLPAAV